MKVVTCAYEWARLHVGHRGTFLLFLAVLDMLYGMAIHIQPPHIAPVVIPWATWGNIWWSVGVILVFGAFQETDRVYYAVAVGLKAAWAAVFLNLAFVRHVPHMWLDFVLWAVFAGVTLAVSTWPDYNKTRGG